MRTFNHELIEQQIKTNQKDFEAQFPDKFLEFMDQKHSKEQVIYTLPVEVEKTVIFCSSKP